MSTSDKAWFGLTLFVVLLLWLDFILYQHFQHETRAAAIAAGLEQTDGFDGPIWVSKEVAEIEAKKQGTRIRY